MKLNHEIYKEVGNFNGKLWTSAFDRMCGMNNTKRHIAAVCSCVNITAFVISPQILLYSSFRYNLFFFLHIALSLFPFLSLCSPSILIWPLVHFKYIFISNPSVNQTDLKRPRTCCCSRQKKTSKLHFYWTSLSLTITEG